MTDQEYRFMQRRLILKSLAQPAYDWLLELTERYKKTGEFNLSLTDYYSSDDDIEIAAVTEALIPLECKGHDNAIRELRSIIGDSPSKFVELRDFLPLMAPGAPTYPVLFRHWVMPVDIANILDWCWQAKYKYGIGIKDAIMERQIEMQPLTSVLRRNLDIKHRISMIKLKLATDDGVGRCVWSDCKKMLFPTPWIPDMRYVIGNFYPLDAVTEMNFEEIAEFIGFDNPNDILYAYWAYKKAFMLINDDVKRLESNLKRKFNLVGKSKARIPSYANWRLDKFIPPIPF